MLEASAHLDAPSGAEEWRRLSPWSILHFAARAVADGIRGLVAAAPATYGAARSPFAAYAWTIPAGVTVLLALAAVLGYRFYFYRIRGDMVEVRRGVLFKKHLKLAFARIQNIDLDRPFYYRPLGLVTLKLDSAGASGDEVHLAALERDHAEALRAYILRRKRELGGDERVVAADTEAAAKEVRFTRSTTDLVVHGLTNNRAYLAIAAVTGLVWQADLPLAGALAALWPDIDSLRQLPFAAVVLVFAAGFVATGAVVAMLSVAVAVVLYYDFKLYRTGNGLGIERGLLTRRETHVQRSRIQAVLVSQDWLELLLGRCNVTFEQISHGPRSAEDWQSVRNRILVPSVRSEEVEQLVDEAFGWRAFAELDFTPISKRYFYKHGLIASCGYVVALAILAATPISPLVFLPAALALWAVHVALICMRWKRAGLAIDRGMVVARYGLIGICYHVFPAFKIQSAAHVQSVLMRRRGLSDVVLRTAASRTRVPYLPASVAKAAVDYCVYEAEASDKSWM